MNGQIEGGGSTTLQMCTKCYWIFQFKMVNSILWKFHLNKLLKSHILSQKKKMLCKNSKKKKMLCKNSQKKCFVKIVKKNAL